MVGVITFDEILNRFLNQFVLIIGIGIYYFTMKKINNRLPEYREKEYLNSVQRKIGLCLPKERPIELLMAGIAFGLISSVLARPEEKVAYSDWLIYLYFIVAVLMAPFFEELLFRGVIYDALRAITHIYKKQFGGNISTQFVFSSVYFLFVPFLFAEAHTNPFQKMIPGMIYAILYYSSKSIYPGWAAHLIFNSHIAFYEITGEPLF